MLPKTIQRAGNYDIVNYRRGLASLDLDFRSYSTANEFRWGDANYNKEYDPQLMEMYSLNRDPAGNRIIDTAGGAPVSLVNNTTYNSYVFSGGVKKTPFAADPFLGLNGARVNPFYTFYCLDRAYEVKARIRMAIRDWDRVFPSTTADLELISDVYKTPATSRRMDLPGTEEEVQNDPGRFNLFNDQNDWDVKVPMERTNSPTYVAGTTFWNPATSVSYPTGFWNPSYFPSLGPVSGD